MNIKKIIFETVSIIVGNAILAFAVSFFIIPNNILSGGVPGVAIAISPLLNIDVQTLITIIIIICYILGYLFLGKSFAIKTLTSSLVYPIFINLFSRVPMTFEIDPILASLYGGLISGVGIGIVFRMGSSTGGMDVPPIILAKYTNIKAHTWMMIVDALTIALGIATHGLNSALIGLISAWSLAKMVGAIQTFGGEDAKQVLIITDEVDSVLEMILVTLDRGATLLEARGGYTRKEKNIIMTILLPEQYAQLEKAVKEIDEDAFLIVSDVTEVQGHGFYKN